MAIRVWVVRHGDRFDFEMGDKGWREIAQRINDPCLSDLGNTQAAEMAQALVSEGSRPDRAVTSIVTSPFLRCVETANPIAGRLGLPLKIEHSLFEVVFTDEYMPPLNERACYFPRIDLKYESLSKPPPNEEFPSACMARYGEAAETIVGAERFAGQSLVLVTHAAGVVSIVARLLKKAVREVPAASPCCLFCLDRETVEDEWVMSDKYNGTTAHLSNSGATLPWPREEDDWARKFLDAGDYAPWL